MLRRGKIFEDFALDCLDRALPFFRRRKAALHFAHPSLAHRGTLVSVPFAA